MTRTPVNKIRQDLEEIVSGNFTPDALGPEAHAEILARAEAEPKRYLETMVKTYLGGAFDAVAISHLRLPLVIELLTDADPATAQATATLLLRHLDGLLVVFDEATDKDRLMALLPTGAATMHRRLDRQRYVLRGIIQAEEPDP